MIYPRGKGFIFDRLRANLIALKILYFVKKYGNFAESI